MKKKIQEIKEEYQNFAAERLAQGKLMYRQTSKGVWGISDLDETLTLFKKLGLKKSERFLDLGSGDGRVVMLASLFTKAEGIEIDPKLYAKSQEIKKKLKSKAVFHNKDFLQHDLTGYDFVYCFPDTALHRGLEQKLKDELTGRLVVLGHTIYPVDLKKEMELQLFGQPVTVYTNK